MLGLRFVVLSAGLRVAGYGVRVGRRGLRRWGSRPSLRPPRFALLALCFLLRASLDLGLRIYEPLVELRGNPEIVLDQQIQIVLKVDRVPHIPRQK